MDKYYPVPKNKPFTKPELARAKGVSPQAIGFRLATDIRDGKVVKIGAREQEGRGRPTPIYKRLVAEGYIPNFAKKVKKPGTDLEKMQKLKGKIQRDLDVYNLTEGIDSPGGEKIHWDKLRKMEGSPSVKDGHEARYQYMRVKKAAETPETECYEYH